jgi:hypothetical protein
MQRRDMPSSFLILVVVIIVVVIVVAISLIEENVLQLVERPPIIYDLLHEMIFGL